MRPTGSGTSELESSVGTPSSKDSKPRHSARHTWSGRHLGTASSGLHHCERQLDIENKTHVSSLLMMIASRAPTYTAVSRAGERNEDVTHQQASFMASVYVSKSAGAQAPSTSTTIWSRRCFPSSAPPALFAEQKPQVRSHWAACAQPSGQKSAAQ
eukprot:COSAG02_NODE_25886_length_646_cov_1.118830_1_plen_156_part_00